MDVSSLLDASAVQSGSVPLWERRACQVRLSQRLDNWSFEYIPFLAILRTWRGWVANTLLPVTVGQCNVAEQSEQGLHPASQDPRLPSHTSPFLQVPRACFTEVLGGQSLRLHTLRFSICCERLCRKRSFPMAITAPPQTPTLPHEGDQHSV